MIGRVLVVEPVTTNRIVMKARLASAHYEVVCCDTLRQAMDEIDRYCPDFVFFDANLGLPSLAKVRLSLNETTDGANVPLVAIGNLCEGHVLSDILNHGGQDLIQWPINPDLMRARLRSLMRQTQFIEDLRVRSLGIPSSVGDLAGLTPTQPVTVVARTPARAAAWADRIRPQMPTHEVLSSSYAGVLDPRLKAADGAVYLLVADPVSEPEDILHILSTLKSRSNGASTLYLTAFPRGAELQAASALDMGAGDVAFLDQDVQEVATRLGALSRFGAEISGLNIVLQDGLRLALLDRLTGLHNRHYSDHNLPTLVHEAHKSKDPMALMIFDVDHFKHVNDTHGHLAGDRVLVQFAKILKDQLGDRALLARIGGEEFLAALPRTDAQAAIAIANAVREQIENTQVVLDDSAKAIKVTTSVGISISYGSDSPIAMISQADDALYRAKIDGRNRARLSPARVASVTDCPLIAPVSSPAQDARRNRSAVQASSL